MKTLVKTFASGVILLLLASTALAQTAPDAAELTKLLNEFLAGASRNDPAVHERFWAEDLIYTRSAGRRVSKADILRELRAASAPKPGEPKSDEPKTVYTAEDIRIQQYGDTAIVAFRLVATTDADGVKQVQNLLNSGTFLKRDGKWQVVNWQSTRMPRTEEENKADVAAVMAAFYPALVAGNVKRLRALTDASIVLTDNGKRIPWQLILEGMPVAPPKSQREPVTKTINVYGDTAVVLTEWKRETEKPAVVLSTITLVNQGGAWKIVAVHSAD